MPDLHLKNAAGRAVVSARSSGGLARRLLLGGAAAGGLAATLLSSPCHASADATAFGDFGVYVGYTWGEGGGFTWGIEGRVGAIAGDEWDLECGGETLFAGAGVARLGLVDLEDLRLGLAGQLGATVGPGAAMFDAGLGYRFGEHGGPSLPLGLDLQVWGLDTMVNVDPLLRGGFVGGGLRYPAMDRAFGCVVEGRPLHDEQGRAPLPALRALAPFVLRSERDVALAGEWSRRARAEWASVPAFLQLAEQLEHARAPRTLVARALVAAADEVRHAMLTAGATSRIARAPVAFDRVTPATRAPAFGRPALVRLAVESWLDGCLGEGGAAAKAAHEAELAEDDGIRAMQRSIATEEASHAELGWDVMTWAMRAGGEEVREALWAIRDAESVDAPSAIDDVDLRVHGVLSADERRRVSGMASDVARSRLRALLS
ncbi:MAG: hypothetical protein IT379_11715 [Deltaproteobacteria bacterium]|nr:hypothetical protein [Deltaproteobacteria bacterium]